MTKRLLALAFALLCAAPVAAQNPVSVAQWKTAPVDVGTGTQGLGTIRVVLATDQAQLTNALKVDGSGVVQPVSGTVTVTQATGTNLHAVLDTTSTTAVTQATAANLNAAVVGTGAAGTAATGVVTVQGIASMTPLLVTPAANSATNVAQFGGNNVVTGTGAAGNGIPRVTISNDSSLAANQSVNVAQMNGVTVTMGAGATGTGVQRTNDVASSATGAAPPASAAFIGGLGSGATGGFLTGMPVGDTQKPISITSGTTTLIVTGVSGRHVRITHLDLVTAVANNVAVISGTGATCGTGTAGIAGGTTAANGWNFAANGGIAMGSGVGIVAQTQATGDSVCIITSAAGPLAGSITYAIY